MRFSLDIDLSILFILYLSHFLSHSFHFFLLRFVENLCTLPKKGMDSLDETYSLTSYEPEDAEYDDAALEDMLREAHRVHVHHSQREDLSVGQSSSSVSERTGRPVGERAGRPAESSSQDAQIRTLLDRQSERILRQKLTDTNFKLIMTEVYES